MACELWALDPGAGEAVLRDGDRWVLVSMETAWRPVELAAPEGALEWSLSRNVVRIGRQFPSEDDAVIATRHVCRASWRTGATSSEEIEGTLAEVQRHRERLQRNPELRGWNQRFPEIRQEALKLDRYFRAQGCPVEESLDLILETLEKFRESGGWKEGGDDSRPLLKIARAVYQARRRKPAPGSSEPAPLSDHERRRLERALGRLPFDTLAVLALWSESAYSPVEVAILLHMPLNVVEAHLGRAEETLRRSAGQLRDPTLAGMCRRLVGSLP